MMYIKPHRKMNITPKTHVTALGKMTDLEVQDFQKQLPSLVEKMRADGVVAINTNMTYKLSTVEDMARVADGHQASLQKDIPLLAATFKVAEKEKDADMVLAEIFPWVVFAPDLGDNLALSTNSRHTMASGANVRQAARAHDFVDDAIARATIKSRPGF